MGSGMFYVGDHSPWPFNRGTQWHRRLFYVLGMLLLAGAPPLAAQTGGIMVAPTRITLGPGERAGQVFVINQSNEPITARISLVNRHMLEDGSFAEAGEPQPGEHFADSFVQYAPRRVHLGAGQGQTVRILVRPPAGRPAEYRSHLLFRVEPPSAPDRSSRPDGADGDSDGISIQLIPVYGVSIPVIVRTGELSASAAITGLAVQRTPRQGQPPRVTFQLHRDGNRSVYGDVRVFHQPRAGGAERLVGRTRGLAVYPPLPMRQVVVPLNQLDGDSLPPGRIRVQYVDHDNTDRVLAEAESTVP